VWSAASLGGPPGIASPEARREPGLLGREGLAFGGGGLLAPPRRLVLGNGRADDTCAPALAVATFLTPDPGAIPLPPWASTAFAGGLPDAVTSTAAAESFLVADGGSAFELAAVPPTRPLLTTPGPGFSKASSAGPSLRRPRRCCRAASNSSPAVRGSFAGPSSDGSSPGSCTCRLLLSAARKPDSSLLRPAGVQDGDGLAGETRLARDCFRSLIRLAGAASGGTAEGGDASSRALLPSVPRELAGIKLGLGLAGGENVACRDTSGLAGAGNVACRDAAEASVSFRFCRASARSTPRVGLEIAAGFPASRSSGGLERKPLLPCCRAADSSDAVRVGGALLSFLAGKPLGAGGGDGGVGGEAATLPLPVSLCVPVATAAALRGGGGRFTDFLAESPGA
jgi:hypothetical protein